MTRYFQNRRNFPTIWASGGQAGRSLNSTGPAGVGVGTNGYREREMNTQKVHLHIGGMSCEHCVKAVQRALLETEGAISASVDLEQAEAVIQYDPALAQPEQLVASVEEAGYQASVMPGGAT
jgi:copper chaperone